MAGGHSPQSERRLACHECRTDHCRHPRYLDALAGDAPADPTIRALVDQSVRRLQLVSANLLYRGYPRLMQPPLNLEPDELFGASLSD